ncbi:uncharacterized protein K02A2.6-like [Acropora millepora]|uniref:uncharacterized protein K02A2.6-like n=1 Tax=Acropora millepora TaxID=45264 RepID=UPI001CF0FECB|nr:uncharacterized protein K02A2.6-like [Acropora millepora]
MELDTGASVTVIPEEMWEKELGSVPLVESSVTLKSYSGHAIPVVGETTVHVQYQTQQFPKLFDGKLGTIKGFKAELKVKENAPPQYFKPRTVPFALRDKVEAEIQRLEKAGVLKKVESSDWATPIVPVLKPNGTIRICGDFKVTLNQYLDVPEYPMPTSEELFTKLNGGELFTKLDLSHAYQQVVLDKKSQPYVTVTTHLGLYRYTRLPFGVAAAPAIFQQIIDKMLDGLSQTRGILDDLTVTGENDEQLARNLYKTLKKFEESGAKFKKSKCVIMQPKIEYFAFVPDRHGIHPSPAKVQAILDRVSSLQSKLEIQLAVDASPVGLGAVISHITEDGTERPIAYASRSLTKAERNYSVIEKEALAIIFGIRKFQQYLYGRKFTLLTDHQPLTLLFGPKRGIPPIAASRLQRWAIQLSAYQYEIRYRSSKQNANADAFSRLPSETKSENQDFEQKAEELNKLPVARVPINAKLLREETARDAVLSRALHFTFHRWPDQQEVPDNLKSYYRQRHELTVEDGCLLRGTRVVIPVKHQEAVLAELHLNHPGIVRMKAVARLHVWWPILDSNIEQIVRNCKVCQTTHGKAPLTSDNRWIWPHRAGQRVHVDYCGPLDGKSFLVIKDAKSKGIEVLPMSSTTAEATVQALRVVFSTHGLPEEIVSDNGPSIQLPRSSEIFSSAITSSTF